MTRDQVAAEFHFKMTLLLRDPQPVVDANGNHVPDPISGQTYWEHYYWADQYLDSKQNPDVVMFEFLNDAAKQAKVTLPLAFTQGPPGPAGPPGAFEHHKHTATTDPGIPT